jgi:hypothetical protein
VRSLLRLSMIALFDGAMIGAARLAAEIPATRRPATARAIADFDAIARLLLCLSIATMTLAMVPFKPPVARPATEPPL